MGLSDENNRYTRSNICVTTTTGSCLCVRPYFMFSFSWYLFYLFTFFVHCKCTLGPWVRGSPLRPGSYREICASNLLLSTGVDNNQYPCIRKRRHGLHRAVRWSWSWSWPRHGPTARWPWLGLWDSIGHAEWPLLRWLPPRESHSTQRACSSDSSVFPGTCRNWEIGACSAGMETHPAPERVLHYRVLKHG